MRAARLVRWVLLVISIALIGLNPPLAMAAVPAASLEGTSAAGQPQLSAPRQSLPLPVHDEATCAFCQAAAFAPHYAAGAAALTVGSGAERRELLSCNDHLTHSGSARPPRSRAPPALRFI